ncbi:MAG: hypothetical protein K2Q26_13335 [Bdellovibrionales bacterium]|nr:hypothetical protein [Bdellovibrionales bacterium]
MKKLFTVLCFLSLHQSVIASSSEMQTVINDQSGSFSVGALPKGFTSKELLVGSNGTETVPVLGDEFVKTFNDLQEKEKLNWIDYVTSAPWEFFECPESDSGNHFDFAKECYSKYKDELDVIALNPEKYMGIPILELDRLHAIYKGETLVGYVFEYLNHVEASIIQDGAGVVIYVDADMNVLRVVDWQS